MKILIISNMYPSQQVPYAGIFVKNQFNYLKNELEKDVEMYYMKRTVTSLLGSVWKYFFFFINFTPFLFRQYKIVHVHYLGVHYFLALLYKLFHPSVKIFITLHGTDIHIFKYRKLLLGTLSLYDYLICVSHFQSQLLKKSYGVDADLVLCAGIDQRVFRPVKGVKKEYDFLFVGSFYEIKGVDIFIKALYQIDSQYKICFVGRGDYDQEVLALKNNAQHDVLWIKSLIQKDLVEYYNRSRFLVLPSRGDSFGLVVTESLFSGTPCIVSGDTGTREQVVDGWNGFILEENQAGLLSKKMENALNLSDEEYNLMAQNALNSNKEYSLDFVCKQLNEAYLKMAGGL